MAVADEVNLLLLIELAAVVIGASAFLFYWNRLLGSVVAFLVRLYTWRSYNAYLIIGSLQIAPLAGRISFRDVEYHSSNISVRALHGHVTWRYWKFRIRHETDSESTNNKRNRLPCRITVFAEGVEGFVYNRTPAYDAIVERMKKHEREEAAANASPRKSDDTDVEPGSTLRSRLKKVVKTSTGESSTTKAATSESGYDDHQYPPEPDHHNVNLVKPAVKPVSEGVNWFREALPIDLRIITGSIVLGSDATPMVLIGDFKRAEGTVEVTDSRSTFDLYKTSVNLTFQDASVLMRTNVDYSGPLLAHGKKVYDELLKRQPDLTAKPPSALSVFTGFHLLSKQFKFLRDPKFSTPPVAGLPTDRIWKGLARYREPENGDTKAPKREEREYAKVTTLLETHRLDLTYYADTPGLVPHPSDAPYVDEQDEIGNVDLPPEYGIDIAIHKGNVKYGPEAIQRAFAPSLFFDSENKPRLQPGDTRIHTTLVLHLLLLDETVMRIPTREPSKDWQYDNTATDVERRYGWLDVVVGPNSSISYTQDQVATTQGYDSMLVLQLDSVGISSSVNLDTFIKAKTCKLSMTMPTPLEWDAQRDWGMDVTLDTASISLLRDHVTLISDLAKDWSSGATVGDYHHFVPNHYNFRVSLINYDIHLYINDYNIVDAPWSRDANAFMDVYGPRLDAYVAVASTQYRPEMSIVPFSVSLADARVELCVPKWDTHRAFGPDVLEIGKIGEVCAKGSYLYYSVPKPDHQETLDLHLEGKHVVFKALGWVLRRLFCVKDNYFGTFTQFRTMQEFLEKFDHDPESVGDPIEEKYRPGRSDPFSVSVTMNVEESLVLMSDEIYNCKKGLVIPVPQLQMNLKSVDHFMELSLDATPTYLTASADLHSIYARGSPPSVTDTDIIFIEGIEVKANRLFGAQPHATTYLCLWEVIIPKVSAFLGPDLVSVLQAAGRSVGYTFPDSENSPSDIFVPKTPPDVTFFKVSLDEAAIMVTSGDHGLSVEVPHGFSLDTSTMGTRAYSSMMGISLPEMTLNILERGPRSSWQSVGFAKGGAAIDIYQAPAGWKEAVAQQQEFLRQEDKETSRIWFMYQDAKPFLSQHVNGLYLPQPLAQNLEDRQLPEEGKSDDSTSSILDLEEVGSSSASSSGWEDNNPFDQLRLRTKRSRSFATARETPGGSSVGDESDTVSSMTSMEGSVTSSKGSVYGDMATALVAKLHAFHLAHDRHPMPGHQGFSESTDTQHEAASAPSTIHEKDNGSVVRIRGKAIDIDLKPNSLVSISNLLTAISIKDEGFEKRLDALLVSQVSAVEEESKIIAPQVHDIHLPSIILRLSSGHPGNAILARCEGIDFQISHHAPRNKQAILDVSARTSVISLWMISSDSKYSDISPDMDIPGLANPPANGAPLLSVVMKGLEVAAHHSQGIRARARWTDTTFDILSAAIDLGHAMLLPWQQAYLRVNGAKSQATTDAQVLFTILQKAMQNGYDSYMPAFAYERAYGLHVQDFRNIRTQTGWWILARFRDWYRRIPANQDIDDSIPLDRIADFVVQNLCRVEETVNGAENIIREQHFIQSVFGQQVADNASHKATEKAMDLILYFDKLRISHHGLALSSKRLSSSNIVISKASFGGSQATGKTEQRPLAQMQLVSAVQEIKTDITDGILGLARSSLEYMPEIGVESSADKPVPKEQNAVVIGDLQIGLIDLNVRGGGLRCHLGSSQLHITGLSKKSLRGPLPRAQQSSKETLTANCENIGLSLLQVEDPSDLMADRTIVSLQAEGLATFMDRNHDTRKIAGPEVKLVVGLKTLNFDSRPQLRAFYAFVQTWKQTELP
ncbi:uncharacterized protein I303_100168 [Kwoniella dejecticola CBS 10117]|uniref:Csf1 N-terminal domain-containing protein n=1 Tax=Kwoniella dejecticola CBS 10117 TaxID=1296121 RepID=A0AAJ8MCV5_9TREE